MMKCDDIYDKYMKYIIHIKYDGIYNKYDYIRTNTMKYNDIHSKYK